MRRDVRAIDYVTKDYEGFRQLMIDLIPQYTPEWTDTSQSDFGIVLIELLANGLDILSYYQDKNFREAFLSTAQTRRAVVLLCRMLGYELAPQTPATHKIEFIKDSSFIDDTIVIPKYTKLGTDPEIGAQEVFELLEGDVVIPSGVERVTALATHGETITDDILGISNGEDFQRFKLTYPDVLLDTLKIVTEEAGRELVWENVRDFLSSEQNDRHYTKTTDEENIVTIQFGNGLSGRIPPRNSTIRAQYRVGGGEVGNVGIGAINTFVDTEFAGVTLRNIELHIRGEDVEDIEHAKLVAPKHFRNSGRAVTRQDFEDITEAVPGVAKAKAVETFNESGDVLLYVAPNGYGEVTAGLEERILETLDEVKLIHDVPIVKSVDYVEFDIDIHVLIHENFINADVKQSVEELLHDVYDIRYMEFGENVFKSSIIGEVMKVEGVRNVVVNVPTEDLEVPDTSIAKLREVIVTVTGGAESIE